VGHAEALIEASSGVEQRRSPRAVHFPVIDSQSMIADVQTTTTFELPGFRIARSLGVVRGITVRTRSLPMSIVGGLRTLFGGRAGIFSDLCESAREESFQLMLSHARRMGANAVVGVRYDTGPMVGAAEVLCYGTAVVVEPRAAAE
jgi:uncharacterized protein YbjQ (UPF0145 family)